MIKVLEIFFLMAFAKASSAQGKIIVIVTNIENNKGVCKTCLFANAASFAGKGPALKCADAIIRNEKASHVFDGVPPGVYAIAVFHDANRNNKMDKNFFGIPSEGYGASKNKLPFASAPTFKENRFVVVDKETVSLGIRLRNL